MVTLVAFTPSAHAWLGDDGSYTWSESGTADPDSPVHVFVDVPNEPGAVRLDISTWDDATQNLSVLGVGSTRYYGVEYSTDQIWVSTNGLILFSNDTDIEPYCCSGQAIPTSTVDEPAIFAFWKDLSPAFGGEIWAVHTGTETIVHFEAVRSFVAVAGVTTFQVGIHQDGSFRISIDTLDGSSNDISIGHQRGASRGNQAYFGLTPPEGTTFAFVPDPIDDDGDGFSDYDDCDDGDMFVNPGAIEQCDGQDNTCDGNIDEGLMLEVFTLDNDLDGWGATEGEEVLACFPPSGFAQSGDCDDIDPAINPGAQEDCTAIDNNCDGDPTLDAWDTLSFWSDQDGDGYGTGAAEELCLLPPGAATNGGGDCDDNDPEIYPTAIEIAYDGIDQNCDDLEEVDQDGDGMSDADEEAFGSDLFDEDSDNDGVLDPDEFDAGSDPNAQDSDGDGILDGEEIRQGDSDGDGDHDIIDADDDGDGWNTSIEGAEDFDGDGTPNYLDLDSDGDDILDTDETEQSLLRVDVALKDEACGCATSTPAGGWMGLTMLVLMARRRQGGSIDAPPATGSFGPP